MVRALAAQRRGVAAVARRDSWRWASWPAAGSWRRRSRRAAFRPRGSTRGTVLVTDAEHTAARARHGRDLRARAASWSRRASRPGEVPVLGGFIGATAERRHDDARPRRLGLLGGDLRRVPRRGRDSDLDRRRRHADRRSARRGRAAARAAAVVRRGLGAGVLRREGAASRARSCRPSPRTSRSAS